MGEIGGVTFPNLPSDEDLERTGKQVKEKDEDLVEKIKKINIQTT